MNQREKTNKQEYGTYLKEANKRKALNKKSKTKIVC